MKRCGGEQPAVLPNPVPQVMAKIIVEIPEARLPELPACQTKLGELLLLGLSEMKIQESLLLYQRGLISFARAAVCTVERGIQAIANP